MKILVTGANGYLGRGVVKAVARYGHKVIAADFKFQNDFEETNIDIKECNLFEVENPYEYFDKPDVLLHMAWRNGFVHNSDTHVIDLPKHYEFIKDMCENGIEQVAVIGTMHEVGFYEGCIKENTPCNPMSLYGISKNALREMVRLVAKNNNVTFQWLRGFYIVGNSQYGNSIFSKITDAANNGINEFPFTSGQNQYDFVDYEVFCKQVAATINQKSINGIINICTGKPEKLADRVERFIKDNNYDMKLKYGEFPDRPYDSKAIWGDNSKIEKILNDIIELK